MTLLAVTVIGPDRPGIIAETTGALAGLGGNLEDSTMTVLGGHLAMVLLVSADTEADDLAAALTPLGRTGGFDVAVREVSASVDEPARPGSPYLLSVHGADRSGIVSAVTAVVAGAGGNITDLSTHLTGGLYVLTAEVDVPSDADVAGLTGRLEETARDLGVEVRFHPLDSDLM